MSSPFEPSSRFPTAPSGAPRSEDAIVISRHINSDPQKFRVPLSKKQRNSDEIPSCHLQNPVPRPLPNASTIKSKSSLFYKTRLCLNYRMGTCFNGSKCTFAHGIDDLRNPAPNWQSCIEDERINKSHEQQSILQNKYCRRFYRGEVCPYGDRCTFLHVQPGKLEEDLDTDKETRSMKALGDHNRSEIHHSDNIVVVGSNKVDIWKTKICNKWEETRHCSFGDRCHFAHGDAELKKSGNQMENFVAGSSNSLSNDPTSNQSSACKHQVPEKKVFLKWEVPRKITHIYADWIEDFPYPLSTTKQPKK